MDAKLIETLRQITDEERKILDGRVGVDQTLYTATKEFTIDSQKMLQRGKLIDVRPHTRFVHFPEHKHNYIEIIFICQGMATHIIDRNHTVILEAGDLLFLNQYASHEILPAGPEDIAVNFIVLPEFFDTAFQMIGKDNAISRFLVSTLCRDGGEGQFLHFKAAGLLPVQNLAENMIWSLVTHQPDRRRTNQFTMGLLLLELLNHIDTLDSGSSQSRSRMVMTALHYIEEHYRDGSLTTLAGELNQPVYALSKLIKSVTGVTFKELLQQKRLSRAAQLMRETELSVSDIITAVGYDNTSFFYRVFRNEYGVTPREYRMQKNSEADKE